MNEHGQKKGGSSPYKCRAYPSGSKKRKKAKEANMKEEEVAAKSRTIQVATSQWQCSPAETFLPNLQEDRRSKKMLI